MSATPARYGRADRPLFIGGLMKSGTSLLRVLLGQHPNLFASFETHWYEPEVCEGWADPNSRRMHYLLQFFELSEADYTALVVSKRADPAREFIDIVFDYCAARADKKRWAEKTPDNIRHYSLIRRIWPTAKLIHVTREYRDCFASWKTRRGDTLEAFLASARSAYGDIGALLGKDDDGYLEVDHDELVRAPEQAMRRVLAFAELDWSPACAALDLSATRDERKKIIEVVGKDSHTNVSLSRPIFSDAIGQWRTMLTSNEVRRIETELAPYYGILGPRWGR
jgi:Sulfotransferase family